MEVTGPGWTQTPSVTLSSSSWHPKVLQSQRGHTIPSVSSVFYSVESNQKIFRGRIPEGILIRCLNHLSFLMWKSRNSSSLRWWNSSPYLKSRARPPYRGSSFQPLVSGILFFYSWSTHRDSGLEHRWTVNQHHLTFFQLKILATDLWALFNGLEFNTGFGLFSTSSQTQDLKQKVI